MDRAGIPKLLRDRKGRNLQVGPPGPFVAVSVQRLMMGSAKRDGELVADFASQCSWLGELKVMRVGGGLLADETPLAADEGQVILAPSSRRLFRKGEAGLLSPSEGSSHIGVAGCRRKAFIGWNACGGRRLLVRRMDVGQRGILDPPLVGGLEHPSVRLRAVRRGPPVGPARSGACPGDRRSFQVATPGPV